MKQVTKIDRDKYEDKLRVGRLATVEKLTLLEHIGEEAKKRYQRNLRSIHYKGEKFMEAFHYASDPFIGENSYWLDTGSAKLNDILRWLEYGTGYYGPRNRYIQSEKFSEKTGNKLLLKYKIEGDFFYTRKVKGVKPGFMFTKAVESIRNERNILFFEYRHKMGI